jgi:hypothetical protein
VSVEPKSYNPAFVSTKPGSFKESGFSGNWYAQDFTLAALEARPSGECVYEVSRLSQDTPVANIYGLPGPFLDAIYQDRDLPVVSYEKSHLVLSGVAEFLPPGSVSGIYFPSRRANGGCLVLNPSGVKIDVLYTGKMPPPSSLLNEL